MAYPIDLGDLANLKKHLGGIGIDGREAENIADRCLYGAIKLEGVEPRAADMVRTYLEGFGGALAMREAAGNPIAPETDLIITGSRHVLGLLAKRLEGEPFGLAAVSREIVACLSSGSRSMAWGTRVLDFDSKTYVMGILNCTPDSFYPDSRNATLQDAMGTVEGMIRAGVDIIDIGGESSRPGSDPVAEEEEIRRVIPVVQAIRRESDVMLSLDTRKRDVAERALDCGVDIINDISGLKGNEGLARLLAHRKVPVILMHMRGTPKTMQKGPTYGDTISEILRELQDSVSFALESGIAPDRIIVDPGIGFGKRIRDNLRILKDLASLKILHCPILVGLSRKSFLGEILDRPVEKRLTGTVTANTLAVQNGADILRVHDVGDAVEMVKIIDSIRRI